MTIKPSTKKKAICIALLSLAAACYHYYHHRNDPPKPPITVPFDLERLGSKVEEDILIVDYHSYKLYLTFGFQEGDMKDRERVKKLAGDPWDTKDYPTPPVLLKLSIASKNPSSLEVTYKKEYKKLKSYGVSDTVYYVYVDDIKLKPGKYHFQIENMMDMPQMKGTPVSLFFSSRPKASTLPN